jgi:hypothetical protein
MKTLVVIIAAIVAFPSSSFSSEQISQVGAQRTSASHVERHDTALQAGMWRENGGVAEGDGGIEDDPDVGMPALKPTDPEAPAATRR